MNKKERKTNANIVEANGSVCEQAKNRDNKITANTVGTGIARPIFEKPTQNKITPKNRSNLITNIQPLTSHLSQLTSHTGITLIALVITIIVMLILVGVTVTIALNGGLFNQAKRAVSDTQNAVDIENGIAEGKVQIGGNNYNSIEEGVNSILGLETEKDTGKLGTAIGMSRYGEIVKEFHSEIDSTLVWRIFYADENNVYLISETETGDYPGKTENLLTYIDNYKNGADVSKQAQDLMPLAKDLFVESNENNNIRGVAYLCDTKENGPWDKYTDKEGFAVWAMAGPTVELFVASYNATQNQTKQLTCNEKGYDRADLIQGDALLQSWNGGIYRLTNGAWWWLASPCQCGTYAQYVEDRNGTINPADVHATGTGWIRPVVCIPQSNFEILTGARISGT